MNQMRKSTIITRIRDAWAALRAKPTETLTIGIETRRCEMCDYYKAAHVPAQTAEDVKKLARQWVTGSAPAYYHELEYLPDRVLVTFYKATEDGVTEIGSSYGFFRLGEGAAGVAQATSYAMSLLWFKIQKQEEGDV